MDQRAHAPARPSSSSTGVDLVNETVCSAGVFLLPIKAVSGTLKADDRYSQALVFCLVLPISQLR